ncbi:hypothetical protein GIB67_003003 [Kingdonia uniflora]|uniref:Glycosyltransferase n=1 Tax=Kingdonia uniflora TaxID=39325 RepID=A0A7J7LYL2_9MAGN|nr:hypothetical protein GIB67_003003 [Kingdonia uniflora]
MSNPNETKPFIPHIAILTSSGMGHLTPSFRLAALLANNNCLVTFVTTHLTVSLAESNSISSFLSTFPQIISRNFTVLPLDPTSVNSTDPFFLQWETIRRSAHLLSPLLASSSPPLTTLVTDMMLASSFVPATADLCLPNYILFTSSAKMCSLFAYFPTAIAAYDSNEKPDIFSNGIHINDSLTIPKSWLPPPLLDPTHLFATQFVANGKQIIESAGILINTFEGLETESLQSLNRGNIVKGLPQMIPVGPLAPCDFERGQGLPWLDNQPDNSVVYVSFGSRTSMSREQIKELGNGLLTSGYKFLWVVKDKKVDKDDEDGVEEIVGHEFIEKAKDKGLVVKTWVDQVGILSHQAVGGFVTHCGWNSVVEAALCGVPMLAWPQGGDQKINANVVESRGLGLWVESWGWGGGELVKAEEIGTKIRELMINERFKIEAAHVKEKANNANKNVRALINQGL